jgi:hypothetical protein
MANEMNEKYLGHYVDVLTNTVTDAILKNVSLQATAKLSDGVVKELTKINEQLGTERDSLKETLEELKNKNSLSESARVTELENKINDQKRIIDDLTQQVASFNQTKREYESVKSQVSHLESFRGELVKVREENRVLQQSSSDAMNKMKSDHDALVKKLTADYESATKKLTEEHELVIKKLNEKIDYLQLTPAKRKKVDAEKASKVQKIKTELNVVPKAKIFKVDPPALVVKDGGSF